MNRYILALDEGTTSARAILFDAELHSVSEAHREITQIYEKEGYVEQDPTEIYAAQYSAITECIVKSGVSPNEIAAIGITNQRETTVLWDKSTGKPVYNAIVWQCRRTAEICESLKPLESEISEITGLKTDAYFSGTKIKWILDNVDGAREKAERGELLFGTIDTFLIWKLTGGKVHATDVTNASRTMLFDINSMSWSKRMLEILNVPESLLPEVKSSSEIYGYAEIMGAVIGICGVAGDQQAALFGHGAINAGDAKNTYGTGCFLLANIGEKKINSSSGLITTVAANVKGKPITYCLEGSVFIGGAVIQWLRDEMRFFSDSKDSEYFAKKVQSSGGVYFVPAFSGLGAPEWDMNARGTITGITRGTKRSHIIRAALEGIAYQVDDVIKAMSKDLGMKITSLSVDGGAANNGFLTQFQADISDVTVNVSQDTEVTARGAAILAGLASGIFKKEEDAFSLKEEGKNFSPAMTQEQREKLLLGWHNAINACRAATNKQAQ